MKNLRWIPQGWAWGFIVAPLIFVVLLSFQSKGVYGGTLWTWSLQNYFQFFESSSMQIFFRTIWMALVTAFVSTLLAGFVAGFISQGSPERRTFWLSLFLIPFFINSLIRLYSLQFFVGAGGPIQAAIKAVCPDFDGTTWSHNTGLMYIGLVMTYLPFALLPLVSAYEKWDWQLTEASYDLGAQPLDSFWLIKWPLLRPAYAASFFIVLIPSLGEFLVPEILEGAKNLYWGQYITEAYLKWRHWPLGSTLGVVLLGFLFFMLWLGLKVQRWQQNPK